MKFEVLTIPQFDRDYKKLARKYPSLKSEVRGLIEILEQEPVVGQSLGNHCYKIRLAIASKGKGKSGGARVITCVKILQTSVYLLTMFDKSDKESISDKELKELLKHIP